METLIKYEKRDYGMLTLNRSKKYNAINIEMAKQLSDTLKMIKTQDISFLVITSEGSKVFCAGGDLTEFHSSLTENDAFEKLMIMNKVLYQLATLPVPTICLLNGNALGGGCELAGACDIRIAREGTTFGFVQSNIGILPGWGGGALLYERVPHNFAYHWLLTGEIYDAQTLVEKGWIHQIIAHSRWDDLDSILTTYLTKSRQQMLFLKEQFIQSMQGDMEAAMETETRNCAQLWGSETHQMHVKQFMEK